MVLSFLLYPLIVSSIENNDYIVRVSERNVSSVDRIIRVISFEKEEVMRKTIYTLFVLLCAGENLGHYRAYPEKKI